MSGETKTLVGRCHLDRPGRRVQSRRRYLLPIDSRGLPRAGCDGCDPRSCERQRPYRGGRHRDRDRPGQALTRRGGDRQHYSGKIHRHVQLSPGRSGRCCGPHQAYPAPGTTSPQLENTTCPPSWPVDRGHSTGHFQRFELSRTHKAQRLPRSPAPAASAAKLTRNPGASCSDVRGSPEQTTPVTAAITTLTAGQTTRGELLQGGHCVDVAHTRRCPRSQPRRRLGPRTCSLRSSLLPDRTPSTHGLPLVSHAAALFLRLRDALRWRLGPVPLDR